MGKTDQVKTAVEIGALAGQLSAQNQTYVRNTINTLLYSQEVYESKACSAETTLLSEENR